VNVAHTILELRESLAPSHRLAVGLVPTMGALHDGHGALIAAARGECDLVVVSIFVNAPQFTDDADLAAYPRDLDGDVARAEASGADLVFAPSAHELYPAGFATWIEPGGVAEGLEGAARPGHFQGVATICLKLFNLVRPQRAYFGRKDAQQIAVLHQLVRDLNVDVEIRPVTTVRDTDGLALSSRNARLAPDERERAAAIPRALATRDPERARAVLAAAGLEPEYVEIADLDGPTLALAVLVGSTRLIDNFSLEGAPT